MRVTGRLGRLEELEPLILIAVVTRVALLAAAATRSHTWLPARYPDDGGRYT